MNAPAHARPEQDRTVYCGAHDDTAAASPVWLEDGAGEKIGLLAHPPHPHGHEPTPFSWGYGGAGPASLARALLVDALGDDARCPLCQGHRSVAYLPEAALDADPVPLTAELRAELDRAADTEAAVSVCWECEGTGVRRLPVHSFKDDVVALLEKEWTLSRGEVRQWYRQHQELATP